MRYSAEPARCAARGWAGGREERVTNRAWRAPRLSGLRTRSSSMDPHDAGWQLASSQRPRTGHPTPRSCLQAGSSSGWVRACPAVSPPLPRARRTSQDGRPRFDRCDRSGKSGALWRVPQALDRVEDGSAHRACARTGRRAAPRPMLRAAWGTHPLQKHRQYPQRSATDRVHAP